MKELFLDIVGVSTFAVVMYGFAVVLLGWN